MKTRTRFFAAATFAVLAIPCVPEKAAGQDIGTIITGIELLSRIFGDMDGPAAREPKRRREIVDGHVRKIYSGPSRKQIAAAIDKALDIAIKNGKLDALIDARFGEALKSGKFDQAIVVRMAKLYEENFNKGVQHKSSPDVAEKKAEKKVDAEPKEEPKRDFKNKETTAIVHLIHALFTDEDAQELKLHPLKLNELDTKTPATATPVPPAIKLPEVTAPKVGKRADSAGPRPAQKTSKCGFFCFERW